MIKAKEKLQEISEQIQKKFPDEPDLKGFLGISKVVIVAILEECSLLMEKLKEFDNNFETIVLKRELDELFSKIRGNLKKDFSQINHGSFNSILRVIAKIQEAVRTTYFLVSNEEHVRTEAELVRIKGDLDTLLADTEALKKVKQELTDLQTSTVNQVQASVKEFDLLKATAKGTIDTALSDVEGLRENALSGINSFYDQTKSTKEKADELFAGLIKRDTTATQNLKKIEEFASNIEKKGSSIEAISNNVTQWNEDISRANTIITSTQRQSADLLEQSKKLLTESDAIRVTISGKPDAKNVITGGLLQDGEKLKTDLSTYLEKQKEKYDTQFTEIEGLLAGATSVGLAKAYQEQKDSYRKPLFQWSIIFVVTLSVMIAFSGYVIFEQFQKAPITNLNEALTALFRYLPFYLPTIWLVAHASKQQSQARQLQQEYAFKETNAKSYLGHKEQIEKLIKEGGADKDLLEQLMSQMVVITGQNPSSTLNHQSHNDSPPIFKLVESLIPGKKKSDGTKDTVSGEHAN